MGTRRTERAKATIVDGRGYYCIQVKSALAGHCALRAISANCKVSLPSINFQEQVAPLHRCRRIRTHQPGPSACNVLALKTEVTYFYSLQ